MNWPLFLVLLVVTLTAYAAGYARGARQAAALIDGEADAG